MAKAKCERCESVCDPICLTDHQLAKLSTNCDSERISPQSITGIECLKNKKYSKGLAFTIEERQFLGIHGLLPPVVKTRDDQLQHCLIHFDRLRRNIDKYLYLMNLSERSQSLFYQLLRSDVSKFLPIINTPTVGEVCQKYGLLYQVPRGVFINIMDKGHVYDVLGCWQEKNVRIVVFTDGGNVLGLGDLGSYGMGVPIGKAVVHSAIGGIKPEYCLPVMLDCGTNTDGIIIDPLYIGLREKRIRGACYDEFIDEFMHAVTRRFGQTCLFHFEDFGNENAFRFLAKYQNKFCMFNGDIQASAAYVLSGILTALKVSKQSLKTQKIFFFGAGQAGIGIARLLVYALIRLDVPEDEARKLIWMFDSKGLIVKDRPAGGLTSVKLDFAQNFTTIEDFLQALETIRPNILVGSSGSFGAFTPKVLRLMALMNKRPIIFALSNPDSKSECTAKDAYLYTNGKCLFASGTPFQPFDYEKQRIFSGQSNNVQILPAIVLGVLCSGMRLIPDEVFFIASETLSELVTSEDLAKGLLFPPLSKWMCCALEIARWVMEYAYRFNLATVYPEPQNKYEFIKAHMYDSDYPEIIPEVYLKDDIW